MTDVERCPKCNGVLAIIGRVHLCRPVEVGIPATKPRFGDVVNVPLSEMPARGIGPKRARDPLSAQGAGPAPAKKASTTYDHRDPKLRREYQRELMRKRRAAKT